MSVTDETILTNLPKILKERTVGSSKHSYDVKQFKVYDTPVFVVGYGDDHKKPEWNDHCLRCADPFNSRGTSKIAFDVTDGSVPTQYDHTTEYHLARDACRGLWVQGDHHGDKEQWKIIARPYNKFYEVTQLTDKKLPTLTGGLKYLMTEKWDGSMVGFFKVRDHIVAFTMRDVTSSLTKQVLTFVNQKCNNKLLDKISKTIDDGKTPMFEYIHKKFYVKVPYGEIERLVHIADIDITTGSIKLDEDLIDTSYIGINRLEKDLKRKEFEGFVAYVIDNKHTVHSLVKIKSDWFNNDNVPKVVQSLSVKVFKETYSEHYPTVARHVNEEWNIFINQCRQYYKDVSVNLDEQNIIINQSNMNKSLLKTDGYFRDWGFKSVKANNKQFPSVDAMVTEFEGLKVNWLEDKPYEK